MDPNYKMHQFFKSITGDLYLLDKMDKSKNICKLLSETIDEYRCSWANIQSTLRLTSVEKLRPSLLKLNDLVNTGMDAGYTLLIREQNDHLLDFYEDEVYLSYTFFLDALHAMDVYYTISINFPYQNLTVFSKRKQAIYKALDS